MSLMMQCYPSQTFVDDTMKPLVSGRLTVYKHDSNVLADIYTLEGADYVPCANPVRLDEAGRLVASIFSELGVYDVRLEKYNGIQDSFELFDTYEIGIDARLDQIGNDSVADIDALMSLDPTVSSSIVTVESYPVRNYIWDANAIDAADGGVVVGSDVSATGRWLLLWDCPYLPSSVYGVVNGDTTNINALFSYAAVIGSMNMATPPAIRMEAGHYDLAGYSVCQKHLALDPGVTFDGDLGLYDNLELFGRAEPGHAIGNITFLHKGCTAYSWWYNTVQDFWTCGADIFVVCKTNYFSDTKLKVVIDLADKVVVGDGTLVTAYTNNGRFRVWDTTDIPDKFFSPTTDVVYSGDSLGDSKFKDGSWDVGLLSGGHRQEFYSYNINDYSRTNIWWQVMACKKAQFGTHFTDVLDLQGRTLEIRPINSGFSYVRNGTFAAGLSLSGSSTMDFTLDNVQCSDVSVAGRYLTVIDSNIIIPNEPSTLSALWVHGGRISTSHIWSRPGLYVTMDKAWNGISFNRVTDNKNRDAVMSFVDCTFMDNTMLKSKNVSLRGCTLKGCTVEIYPYYDTSTSTYKMEVDFVGNDFISTVPVKFTKFDGGDMSVHDQCYDVVCTWNIVNNSFSGNAEGIQCRYFTNRSNGNVYDKRFIAAGSDKFIVNYSGNVGQCPQEDMHGYYLANWNKDHETYTIDEYNLVYCYYGSSMRAMPVYSFPSTDTIYAHIRGRMQTARMSLFGIYDWEDSAGDFTVGMGHPGTWQIDTRGTQPGDNGDFFKLGLSTIRVNISNSYDVRGL